MSGVKAVIFDAFGTVLRIHQGCSPYRQILRHGRAQGRRIRPDDAGVIMTKSWSLQDAAFHFGIALPDHELARIQTELDEELQRIEPYEDALAAIAVLKGAGIKVAICSNLAMPYQEPLERLFPNLDAYGYSFAVGALKPDPSIYQAVLDQLSVDASDAWMIGDSQRCDREGPRAFGIKGHYLSRSAPFSKHAYSDLENFTEEVINLVKN